MWYIIHMKRFLKDIAQGIYDGLQENDATHNQYSFQENLALSTFDIDI